MLLGCEEVNTEFWVVSIVPMRFESAAPNFMGAGIGSHP